MSGTNDAKAGPVQQEKVHEVQGVFPDDATMQGALSQLTLAGYDRADFSLPEEQEAHEAATPNESAAAPTDDADKRQVRTMGTSMAGYAGAVAAAGATANAAGQAADNAQIEARDQRGREGRLILAVRTTTPEQVSQVTGLMQQAGASKTEAVTRADQALTAGVSSAGWTGE